MIRKIHLLEKKRHPLELLLDSINEAWRKRPLYQWQWAEHDGRQDLDPRLIYYLPNFDCERLPREIGVDPQTDEPQYAFDYKVPALLYTRGAQFLLETQGTFSNVLTNMKPVDTHLYQDKLKGDEVTIDDLLSLFQHQF